MLPRWPNSDACKPASAISAHKPRPVRLYSSTGRVTRDMLAWHAPNKTRSPKGLASPQRVRASKTWILSHLPDVHDPNSCRVNKAEQSRAFSDGISPNGIVEP